MTTNLILLLISSVFCSVVIILHIKSVGFMFPLFVRKTHTSSTSFLTSTSIKTISSSVWCNTIENKLLCTFKNLFYAPIEKQFIFVLSDNSILSGVTSANALKTLDLSSIANHNGFGMKLIIITPEAKILRRYWITVEHGFIIWRFKWDNIMHVVHDDLLPLYTTYSNICVGNPDECVSKYQLAFADEGEYGPFSEWYRIFSVSDPILLHNISTDSVLCFKEVRTGLMTESIWFQYGFGIPQGPLPLPKVNGNQIRQFSEFVLKKFNLPIKIEEKNSNAVIFSRKINRKILNEKFVKKALKEAYTTYFPGSSKLKISSVDVSSNSTKEILFHITNSKIVIGMHGSAMIFNIFLKPGSVIVELFPFGINPHHVSAIKALCEVPDIGLIYRSWINKEQSNTITHPDAPPLHGGIFHLSAAEQEQVKSITEVPAVECCHNQVYLYRMFQDTIVGDDILTELKNAFSEQVRFSEAAFIDNCKSKVLEQWYFPAPVTHISCHYTEQDRTVTVTWTSPMNTQDPYYQIAVVIVSSVEFSTNSSVPTFKFTIPLPLPTVVVIDIWIKCIDNNKESIDVYKQCGIYT